MHGGAPGAGALRGNQNATKHARFTLKSRELPLLGRLQNCAADLGRAQWAVMELLARGDAHRVEVAEKHVALCAQQLRSAALALDRVLVGRGDEDGLYKLVEGVLRLTENV
jgi:hypothetical protein